MQGLRNSCAVMSRSGSPRWPAQRLVLELGATSARGRVDSPPEPLGDLDLLRRGFILGSVVRWRARSPGPAARRGSVLRSAGVHRGGHGVRGAQVPACLGAELTAQPFAVHYMSRASWGYRPARFRYPMVSP